MAQALAFPVSSGKLPLERTTGSAACPLLRGLREEQQRLRGSGACVRSSSPQGPLRGLHKEQQPSGAAQGPA